MGLPPPLAWNNPFKLQRQRLGSVISSSSLLVWRRKDGTWGRQGRDLPALSSVLGIPSLPPSPEPMAKLSGGNHRCSKFYLMSFKKAKLQPRKGRRLAKVIMKFSLSTQAGLSALGKGTAAASQLGGAGLLCREGAGGCGCQGCCGVQDITSLGTSSPPVPTKPNALPPDQVSP